MREATKAEYSEAFTRAGYMDVRRTSGKRYFDAVSYDRGVEVCAKHQTITRGKVTNETYTVNPEYLR